MTEFDFDPRKSRSNQEKHGIDFIEAQRLWEDSLRIEIPAKTVDETRTVVIGRIGEKVWSAIVAEREGKTRIISVRRARRKEVEIYEG